MIRHAAYPSEDEKSILVVLGDHKEHQRGITHLKQMQFDCTPEVYLQGIKEYNKGAMIQDAFPTLSAEQREFLISGMLPADWRWTFGR